MSEAIEASFEATPELQWQAAYGWTLRDPERGPARFGMGQALIWALVFVLVLAAFQGWFGPELLLGIGLAMIVFGAVHLWSCRRTNDRGRALYAARDPRTAQVGMVFDDVGFTHRDGLSETRVDWRAVEAVVALTQANGLRMGGGTVPVPDGALPEGLSPRAFRDRLRGWIEARGQT